MFLTMDLIFPIWIRIQDSLRNADSDPQHWHFYNDPQLLTKYPTGRGVPRILPGGMHIFGWPTPPRIWIRIRINILSWIRIRIKTIRIDSTALGSTVRILLSNFRWFVRLKNRIKTRNTACTQEICVIVCKVCKEIRQMRYWNSSGKVVT